MTFENTDRGAYLDGTPDAAIPCNQLGAQTHAAVLVDPCSYPGRWIASNSRDLLQSTDQPTDRKSIVVRLK